MKRLTGLLLLLVVIRVAAQTIPQKLAAAVQQFNKDPQMRHAIMSVCVVDAKTGKRVYTYNEQIGLAPASTQKLFTGVAALDMLGPNYRYKTELLYGSKIKDPLSGYILINGSGDPTLGSWRYADTKEEIIFDKWVKAIQNKGIKEIEGLLAGYTPDIWDHESIPDGWIWQDIGNYYGAGANLLNWHENQYDLILRAGKEIDDSVTIISSGKV
jgi:D-alanyl-D-alanine carboxypeptidase/D-alanyl-D-alanine-endopeptidase (penicillin-binding protein 4)